MDSESGVWRRIGALAAGLSALTLAPFNVHPLLWIAKMVAGAITPILAVVGGLGAIVGLARRDWRTTGAGLCAAAVAARHVALVTRPHDAFRKAFGDDWAMRIPADLRRRMSPRRYVPFQGHRAAVEATVSWERDVVFGTHVETGDPLLCDVWQPPDGVPHTGLGIIYLHGSAWHYLDKDFGTRYLFRHLAAQGHVVMDVAYTMPPRTQIHGMVADVKRAIAWMKTEGRAYGVSPDRVVLMGGSAGGHLALLAAYTPTGSPVAGSRDFHPADVTTDTSVRAVVCYYGAPDMESVYDRMPFDFRAVLNPETPVGWRAIQLFERMAHRTRVLPPYGRFVDVPDFLLSLMGGRPDEMPELYRRASPIHHVGAHCPPTLLFQGAHDVSGWMPDVRRLHRRLRMAGVPSVYVEFPATDHAFDLIFPRVSPAAQAAMYDLERFLGLMVAYEG